MDKIFSVKKYLLYLLAVGICCLVTVGINQFLVQKQNGQELEKIIRRLTYEVDKNMEEIQLLKDFAPAVESVSERNQAVYYRTLTKLYILRDDMDNALLNFVDAQIRGEIAKAYDIIAWLYADTAQIYMEFDSDELALRCIDTALAYGAEAVMEDFFYEYCYVTKGELAARLGDTDDAAASYEKSLEYDAPDRLEYQSMDLRRDLIMADVAMQNQNLDKAGEHLSKMQEFIMTLEYPPMDALWSSGIYYPYLTLQTRYALEREQYAVAMQYMDEMFATGLMYGQISSLMTFLNDILATIDHIDLKNVSQELTDKIEENTRTLVLEYPEAFQNRNNIASTHIYNSNMITIAVFVQKYEMENLYRMIVRGVAVVILIVSGLVMLIQRSVKKGRIDGLTNAYIRRYFNEVYEDLKNSNAVFGIIMYDIDFFKQVNDGFGHEAGDWVLRDTAKVVTSLLDRNAKLFRYGGDEFIIICKKKSLEEMAVLAERIRSSVEKMKWKEGMKVSFSMGVAISDQCENRDVMAKVDEKLYESKEAGRNHVSW